MKIFLYLLLGLMTGALSGLFGIGGAVVIIPALVLLFGFTQHMAQGTTLALMVPPIGLLAAWTYYKNDYVDLRIAGLICLGFFFGGLLGAKLSVHIPELTLRRLFGIFLLVVSVRMILTK